MIVHIVMFKFKEENKEANILKAKVMLEALEEKIEPLLAMEVGVDFSKTERAFDLSLYSTFNSKEDLSVYATHKEHLEVVSFIKEVTEISKVVDYEK
ncbi:MAG: Dabb family protein [Helicobacteraceae bacterium]|nr:Dabb family protein [Helicobacteraceae bacterium]